MAVHKVAFLGLLCPGIAAFKSVHEAPSSGPGQARHKARHEAHPSSYGTPNEAIARGSLSMSGGGCSAYETQIGLLRAFIDEGIYTEELHPKIVSTVSGGGWVMAAWLLGVWNSSAPFGEYCGPDFTEECMAKRGVDDLGAAHPCDIPMDFLGALDKWRELQAAPPTSGGRPFAYKTFLQDWKDLTNQFLYGPLQIDFDMPFHQVRNKRWTTTEWVPSITVMPRDVNPQSFNPYSADAWQNTPLSAREAAVMAFAEVQPGSNFTAPHWIHRSLGDIVGISSSATPAIITEELAANWNKRELVPDSYPTNLKLAAAKRDALIHGALKATVNLFYQADKRLPHPVYAPWPDGAHPEVDLAVDGCAIDNSGFVSAIRAIERRKQVEPDWQRPEVHTILDSGLAGSPFRFFFGYPSDGEFSCESSIASGNFEFFNSDRGKFLEFACAFEEGGVEQIKEHFFNGIDQVGFNFVRARVVRNDIFGIVGGWEITIAVLKFGAKNMVAQYMDIIPANFREKAMERNFPESILKIVIPGKWMENHVISQYVTWLAKTNGISRFNDPDFTNAIKYCDLWTEWHPDSVYWAQSASNTQQSSGRGGAPRSRRYFTVSGLKTSN